jgi:hypothetical protein
MSALSSFLLVFLPPRKRPAQENQPPLQLTTKAKKKNIEKDDGVENA